MTDCHRRRNFEDGGTIEGRKQGVVEKRQGVREVAGTVAHLDLGGGYMIYCLMIS